MSAAKKKAPAKKAAKTAVTRTVVEKDYVYDPTVNADPRPEEVEVTCSANFPHWLAIGNLRQWGLPPISEVENPSKPRHVEGYIAVGRSCEGSVEISFDAESAERAVKNLDIEACGVDSATVRVFRLGLEVALAV